MSVKQLILDDFITPNKKSIDLLMNILLYMLEKT